MIRTFRDSISAFSHRHPSTKGLLGIAQYVETRILNILAAVLPGEAYLKMMYRRGFGKRLNLEDPKGFSEKVQWLKLYDRNPFIPICADKWMVRDYVADRIGDEYLIPVLYHTQDPAKIPFEQFPSKYIIKTNHGSGTNVVVLGDQMFLRGKKQLFNRERVVRQLHKWLSTDYSKIGLEWQYRNIKPYILIEQLLQDESGNTILNDYKLFCFDGQVRFIEVITDRLTLLKEDWYTPKWERVDLRCYVQNDTTLSRPSNLEEMIGIAEKLSDGFVFVRVDLYSVEGRLYFGEMTFHPAGGFERFDPPEFDLELGSLLELPR